MIPDLAYMVAAYTIARLLNTSFFTRQEDKALRQVFAGLAIAVIVWMTIEITNLANDVSDFEF
jgi:muconolactone delta-isomerase